MRPCKYFMVLAVILAAFQACSLKENPFGGEEAEGISLTFFTEEEFAVKADDGYEDMTGEDRWNENLLASVEYFIYPDGGTGRDALVHGYLTNVRINAPYSVPMTEDIVNALCPGNSKYFQVYAIANHERIVAAPGQGGSEDLSGTAVYQLEARTQELNAVDLSEDANGEQVVNSNQSKFLMACDGSLRVGPVNKRQTTVASATVGLKRVAAKISIAVRVEPQVTITNITTVGEVTIHRDEIWEPRMSEANIYLVYGALDGKVSGEPLDAPTLFEHAPIYFDYSNGETHSFSSYKLKVNDDGEPIDENDNVINEENDNDKIYIEETKTGTFYPTKTPFYSNPLKWFYGSPQEPYLKLVIPWDRVEYDGDTRTVKQSKQYYYRVYCPGSAGDGTNYDAEFLRNHWYKVILNVGILGSEIDGGEIIINGTYYVADWQERDTGGQSGGSGSSSGVNDSDKEAEIKGARYLFVNKEKYELYNIDDLYIPYITSDPCEIVDFQASKIDYSGTTAVASTINDMDDWGISLSLITISNGAHIKFEHALNNNISSNNCDVSDYTITFKLRQISSPNYFKQITIVQHPAMYIKNETNTGGETNKGYIWINGAQNNNTDYWYYVSGKVNPSGNNSNINMYVITTTVLDSSLDYVIGDPRETTINNLTLDGNTGAKAISTDGSNRRLSYYYPTSASSETENMVAPSFRIASSYGLCGNSTTLENMSKRCASYQEFGYPAGRWRVPTKAELEYITTLSAKGIIPSLFNTTADGDNYGGADKTRYFSAHGLLMVNADGTVAENTYYSTGWVRCVYDEWYWGDEKISNMNTFTWGDAER